MDNKKKSNIMRFRAWTQIQLRPIEMEVKLKRRLPSAAVYNFIIW